jgi:phage N-6-adenine-methyltransferase
MSEFCEWRSRRWLQGDDVSLHATRPHLLRGANPLAKRFGLLRARLKICLFFITVTTLPLNNTSQQRLGEDIKLARKARRLTQSALADKIGLSIPAIRWLERSQGNLSSLNKVIEELNLVLEGKNLPAADRVGERLALLRKRHGFGQREFARMIGVTQPTLVNMERHGRGRVDTLERALVVLGSGPRLVSEDSRTAFFAGAGNSSAHHGWATPDWLLQKLYTVFGVFDLDPCSSTHDRRTASVSARIHYTVDDDGLSQPWQRTVFVNPPYGRAIGLWTAKAKSEVEVGNARVVVGLVPARTDTTWWHRDVAGSASTSFLRGRLRFGNSEQSAPFPSALIIWGSNPAELDALRAAFPDAWHSHRTDFPSGV